MPFTPLMSLAITEAPSLPRPMTLVMGTPNFFIVTSTASTTVVAFPSRTATQSRSCVIQLPSLEMYLTTMARCFSVALSVDSSMPIPTNGDCINCCFNFVSMTSLRQPIKLLNVFVESYQAFAPLFRYNASGTCYSSKNSTAIYVCKAFFFSSDGMPVVR